MADSVISDSHVVSPQRPQNRPGLQDFQAAPTLRLAQICVDAAIRPTKLNDPSFPSVITYRNESWQPNPRVH